MNRVRYCVKCESVAKTEGLVASCPQCGLPTEERYAIKLQNPLAITVLLEKTDDVVAHEMAGQLVRSIPLITLSDTDEVLYYKEGVYVSGGEAKLAAVIEELLHHAGMDKKATINFVRETVAHVKRRTYIDRSQLDRDPHILNLRNGLLNIETFEFEPHRPSYYSVTQLPVTYDPTADCPKIKQFLVEVLYAEDIPVVQEFTGYCVWKDYPNAKALIFVGEGSNGKSTLIGLIKSLLGITNISSRSLQDLELHRFAKADLFGKLANLYADLSDVAIKSVGAFKMVTGRDPLTGEYKFKTGFTFVNYAKLIFSANKIPEVFEDTFAFFRRWIIITFPNVFAGERENRNLLQALTTAQELSGFLNWALGGLKRLRQNGWAFSNSKSTEEVRLEYIRKSSPIRAFLLDCTVVKSDGRVAKKALYSSFCLYCRMVQLPVVGADTFWKNLPKFVEVQEERITIEDKRVRCFVGLELRLQSDWGKHEPDDDEEKASGTLDGQNGGQSGQVGQAAAVPVQGVQGVHGFPYLSSHPVTEEHRHLVLRVAKELERRTQITKETLLHDVTSQDSSTPDWFDAVWDLLVKDGLLLRDDRGIWRLSK